MLLMVVKEKKSRSGTIRKVTLEKRTMIRPMR